MSSGGPQQMCISDVPLCTALSLSLSLYIYIYIYISQGRHGNCSCVGSLITECTGLTKLARTHIGSLCLELQSVPCKQSEVSKVLGLSVPVREDGLCLEDLSSKPYPYLTSCWC